MARWLEYFKDPKHVGPLETANAVGQAGGGCGDLVRLYLGIEQGVVAKTAFLASGCPAAIAGAEACASLTIGLPLLEAAKIGAGAIAARLEDLPEQHRSCLELSATALGLALERYASSDMQLAAAGRIAVAMSGGVDSATVAAKLHLEGVDIVGVTLRLHDHARPSRRACCTPADIDDARSVAYKTGFAHLVLDMRAEFKAEVIDRFCSAYLAGQTPNPCVECNRNLRFTHLLDKAAALGASKVATGHYVRISGPDADGQYVVRRAKDRAKDQSYMFWAASQDVLPKMLAPLGDLTKNEVRELAADAGLPVADKLDSQDVCFIPDGDYAGFVERETGRASLPGLIVDSGGRVLGEHSGLLNYTVGQRKGLGVSADKPMYVLGLDTKSNQLLVGYEADLAKKSFEVVDFNLISGKPGGGSFRAEVMTRYNSRTKPALIHPLPGGRAVIKPEKPFGPIAPGQSAVFYDGELVLGGGTIA